MISKSSSRWTTYAITALITVASITHSHAKDEPLWELGGGVATLYAPDYRGANESRAYALPLPYFVYRGEKLKMDREGLRGELFNNERFRLELSAAGAVPVSSAKNKARAGMRDLDASLEIGPSFESTLWRSSSKLSKLDLRVPIRAAVTVGPHNSPSDIGFVVTPRLNLDVKNALGVRDLDFGTYVSVLYGSARNHQYFYNVSASEALPGRPAYQARGGFAGTQWVAGVSTRSGPFWVGAFTRLDSVHGAAFEDSPLIKRKTNLYGGVAFAWVFAESSNKVSSP